MLSNERMISFLESYGYTIAEVNGEIFISDGDEDGFCLTGPNEGETMSTKELLREACEFLILGDEEQMGENSSKDAEHKRFINDFWTAKIFRSPPH